MKKFIPLILTNLCLFMLIFLVFSRPYSSSEFDLNTFSQVPILHQGRIKPVDSFARNNLKLLNDKQAFKTKEGKNIEALSWLLDVMSGKPEAREYEIFRIELEELLTLMDLKKRKSLRYSLNELVPKYQDLVAQASKSFQVPDPSRSLFDAKVIELYSQLEIYRKIMQFEAPTVLPPKGPVTEWQKLGAEKQSLELIDNANVWYTLLKAYQNKETETFNSTVQKYMTRLKTEQPDLFPRMMIEQKFNQVQPFYQAIVIFVIVFLCSVLSWIFWTEPLQKTALYLSLVALALFTIALIVRMYLQGRPPVTNLYSSAIFVGWVCVILGLGVEWYLKNGFGTVMSAITGFSALLVAQNLAGDGDTMEMMRAVLDTNFWLATHVTTVTMGYSACFLAGFMGIVMVLMGVFTRKLTKDLYNKISGMIYGIVAFATLFSFVGTVLGGIWADQSWGRFWGWDPKENGALMIVLWNAIILHARWGGIARKKGVALLAIGGNIITAWSWFGVNMLGVGLHSYGFTDKAFIGLVGFVLFNLAVIWIGSLPDKFWRSFNTQSLDEVPGDASH